MESLVSTATAESLVSEDWATLLSICDQVQSSEQASRDCIQAVIKRLSIASVNVQSQSLTVLETAVKNASPVFLKQLGQSRPLMVALMRCLTEPVNDTIKDRILVLLENWLKEGKSLGVAVLQETVEQLKLQGFYGNNAKVTNTTSNRTTQNTTTNTSLSNANPRPLPTPPKVLFLAKALYDFRPADQTELAFRRGDLIRVTQTQHRDWWRGELEARQGVFPSNYVMKWVEVPTLSEAPVSPLSSLSMEQRLADEKTVAQFPIQSFEQVLSSVTNQSRLQLTQNAALQSHYHEALLTRAATVRLLDENQHERDQLKGLKESITKALQLYEQWNATGYANTSVSAGVNYGDAYYYGNYQGGPPPPQAGPTGYPPFAAHPSYATPGYPSVSYPTNQPPNNPYPTTQPPNNHNPYPSTQPPNNPYPTNPYPPQNNAYATPPPPSAYYPNPTTGYYSPHQHQ